MGRERRRTTKRMGRMWRSTEGMARSTITMEEDNQDEDQNNGEDYNNDGEEDDGED